MWSVKVSVYACVRPNQSNHILKPRLFASKNPVYIRIYKKMTGYIMRNKNGKARSVPQKTFGIDPVRETSVI